MKRVNFPERKDKRRMGAEERQEKRNTLSDEQQIQKLVNEGHGDCKEVRRLREKNQK